MPPQQMCGGGAGGTRPVPTMVRRSLSLWIWPILDWPGTARIVRGIRHVLNRG
jgi:hypothetical protein